MSKQSFSEKLASDYSDEVKSEFSEQHGNEVASQIGLCCSIEFRKYIRLTRKPYTERNICRNEINSNLLFAELEDIQRNTIGKLNNLLKRISQISEIRNEAAMCADLSKK